MEILPRLQRFFSQNNIGGLDDIILRDELKRVNEANRNKEVIETQNSNEKELDFKKDEDVSDIVSTLEYVSSALKEAAQFGLEEEVIVWALKAMKEDPTISIIEAFERGCQEWDV